MRHYRAPQLQYGRFENEMRFYSPLRAVRQVRTAYNDNNNNNIVHRTVGARIIKKKQNKKKPHLLKGRYLPES